jgi:DNA replication and repair protein RecF
LIELTFFEKRSSQKPLLLLDDVFSELDPNRQNLLLQAIEGHQTIITTTHLNDPNRLHRALKDSQITPPAGKYLEVSQGTIQEHI